MNARIEPEQVPGPPVVKTDQGTFRQDGKPWLLVIRCALCDVQAPIASAMSQEEAMETAKRHAQSSGFKDIGNCYFCRKHAEGAALVYSEYLQQSEAFRQKLTNLGQTEGCLELDQDALNELEAPSGSSA